MTDYSFYKSMGICTRCHKEKAAEGSTMCPECRLRQLEYNRKYYARCLNSDNPPRFMTSEGKKRKREQTVASNRKRYFRLKEAGICTNCGKREAVCRTLCSECHEKKMKYMREYQAKKKIEKEAKEAEDEKTDNATHAGRTDVA